MATSTAKPYLPPGSGSEISESWKERLVALYSTPAPESSNNKGPDNSRDRNPNYPGPQNPNHPRPQIPSYPGSRGYPDSRNSNSGSDFELIKDCPSDGKCALPYCFCGTGIPGELRPEETPQMVLLTFEGPVTDRTINIFKSLFNGKFRNPNNCPIKGTFFVSHEWNNYDQVQWLFSSGHEIAVNSIT